MVTGIIESEDSKDEVRLRLEPDKLAKICLKTQIRHLQKAHDREGAACHSA